MGPQAALNPAALKSTPSTLKRVPLQQSTKRELKGKNSSALGTRVPNRLNFTTSPSNP